MNWNNRRRTWYYWYAIGSLLFVSININSYFHESDFIISSMIRNFIWSFENLDFFYDGSKIEVRILCAIIILNLLFMIIIVIINHIIGRIPDIKIFKKWGICQFIIKNALIGDIIVGVFLELGAIHGLIQLREVFRITSVGMLLYIALFFCGSYWYWKNTIPFGDYYRIISILKKDLEYEDDFWYCISNSNDSLSTFSRVPWYGKIDEIIIERKDLVINKNIKKENFIYYLVVIDCEKKIEEEISSAINYIVNIPHAKALILLFSHNQISNNLVNFFGCINSRNVRIEEIYGQQLNREINLERIISEIGYRSKNKKNPLRFIKNKYLVQTYLNISYGPCICLDFLKIILNELDILSAIYALFDYVDLQYRIIMVYYTDTTISWMKKHDVVVGNILKMGNRIEDEIKKNFEDGDLKLTVKEIFKDILTESEIKLIFKYLPNYRIDDCRPVFSTIVYLTTLLRNVLRGHGMFEINDAVVLYELIFKFALMNTYILSINEIVILKSNKMVFQNCNYYEVVGKSKKDIKVLSPFLLSTKDGNILVFNNWHKTLNNQDKTTIEYMNYLNGTIELIPIDIDLEKSYR